MRIIIFAAPLSTKMKRNVYYSLRNQGFKKINISKNQLYIHADQNFFYNNSSVCVFYQLERKKIVLICVYSSGGGLNQKLKSEKMHDKFLGSLL